MKKQIIQTLITIIAALIILAAIIGLTACTEAEKVSYNISKEADNFNVVRQLTVMNIRTDSILFQMTGNMSIKEDLEDEQLEVTVQVEEGKFAKHFIKITEWNTYVVEDISATTVDKYRYELNFNPQMVIPFNPTLTVDNDDLYPLVPVEE